MSRHLIAIHDDSMFCHTAKVHIPKGAELLIDNQAVITENKIIAATHIKTGKTIIRKLELIDGKKYLTPLNNRYESTELNGDHLIVGVVVSVRQNL